jgi:hypothetical protein
VDCVWDVFVRGVYCGCFIVLVCVRLSLCGGASRQSRATYLASTKCVQVSLSETCKFLHPSCMKTCNAKALHVFVQLRCTQYEIHKFLREPVQELGCVAQIRATLLRRTCTNLHGACTELARKLVKFCTNLHTLGFLAFKLKDPFPHQSRQVATACNTGRMTKKCFYHRATASSAAASAPGNHHHLRFRPDDPPPTMTTTRDDRAEVPDRASA